MLMLSLSLFLAAKEAPTLLWITIIYAPSLQPSLALYFPSHSLVKILSNTVFVWLPSGSCLIFADLMRAGKDARTILLHNKKSKSGYSIIPRDINITLPPHTNETSIQNVQMHQYAFHIYMTLFV